MSGMVSPLGWRPLLNNLKRYRPEGKAGREDLRGPSNICRLNRKLQCQVTPVGRIGRGDSQRGQDVFDQLEIAGRFGSQGPKIKRCARQLLGYSRG